MTDHNDELIDYEEEDELTTTTKPTLTTTAKTTLGGKPGDQQQAIKDVKKGYVGIHSTSFRDFLLKPELLRAIQDCGFEHPSEGIFERLDLILPSSTRMHSPSHPWNGCIVPSKVGYG